MGRVSWVVTHWFGVVGALVSSLFFLSGWAKQIPFEPMDVRAWGFLFTLSLSATVAGVSARRLWARSRRELVLADLSLLGTAALALAMVEWVVQRHLPPWPKRALHALPLTEDAHVWERILYYDPKAVTLNGWGQRDRERKLQPSSGTMRVAFVGDSYLESSPAVPLPLQVERRMGDRIEGVNLGVSATDPGDYHWRAVHVALPLGSRHVVAFYYLGNDLLEPRANRFWEGAVQPFPRPSLLGAAFPALNHWIYLRRHRSDRKGWPAAYPDPDAWDLARIREAGTDKFRDWLVSFYERYGGTRSEELRERLSERDVSDFYSQLLSPDAGMFRSSMLLVFLRRLTGETKTSRPEEAGPRIAHLVRWAEATRDACLAKGAGFTAVVIPTAFEADARYRDLWRRLAPWPQEEEGWVKETTRLTVAALEARGIDTLDLSPALTGTATYLNADGHWSEAGAASAADAVAAHLRRTLPFSDRLAFRPADSAPGR